MAGNSKTSALGCSGATAMPAPAPAAVVDIMEDEEELEQQRLG